MNRYFKILTTAVAAAGLLASCNREDVTPEQPDLPGISKYEQLTFSTADENAGKAATRAVWSDPCRLTCKVPCLSYPKIL